MKQNKKKNSKKKTNIWCGKVTYNWLVIIKLLK